MSYTPIFASTIGIAGGLVGGVLGFTYDISLRCGQDSKNCSEELLASKEVSKSAYDSVIDDSLYNLVCDSDDNNSDLVCSYLNIQSLITSIIFHSKLLYYYPTAVALGISGAAIGAALGTILDCCVDDIESQAYQGNNRRYRY